MINSPSLSPRQTLQGMSSECMNFRRRLLELALYDPTLLYSDHYTNAMKMLHDVSLELNHLRVPASPDSLALIAQNLPELDSIINRI